LDFVQDSLQLYNGALVETVAMLLHLINCRFITSFKYWQPERSLV